MTEAQLRYGESLRYPIHHYLEDNPATPEQAAVAGYINDCKGHVLREIQGHPHMQNQVALVLQLPPSQRDLLFVHMANSHKRLQDNGAAIGLSSGEARVRFMYAVRNHRHNQPNNGNIIIDHESEIDELLAEENWKEMMKEMVMQGFAGEQVAEDINVLIERRSKEMIDTYKLKVPQAKKYNEEANLYYGLESDKTRETAKNQYRGYMTGAMLYNERFMSAIQASRKISQIYPSITTAPFHKWYSSGMFPDVMEKIMRFERNHPQAFNDESAEAFLRSGFGTLLGVLVMHTGHGWRGKGIAGESNRSRYVFSDSAVEVLPQEVKERMVELGITEFHPKAIATLPKVKVDGEETDKIDLTALTEMPVTNQYIARLLDVFKYNHNIRSVLDELPESTKREFIASFLKESFYENRMTYEGRPDNFIVGSTLPNRNEILLWLHDEIKNRGVVDKISKSGKTSQPNYMVIAYSTPSYKSSEALLYKPSLPDQEQSIPIYKRIETAFGWQTK